MVARRRGRGGARRSTRGTSTPRAKRDDSDDEMVDVSAIEDATPQPVDESQVATPAADDDEPDAEAVPEEEDEDDGDSPPVVQSIPRRRRGGPGRPSRGAVGSPALDDDASDSGTPRRRRGGGRGGTGYRGGFRGRPRWGKKTEPDRMPIDKQGNMVDVIDDEADLPEDDKGEEKVDKSGNLQGGREYRVRVFTITGRAQRHYMLSTEPARCLGFRDSYLFFNKHLSLHKIILTENEKMDLIERDVMPHSYKGRSIGVVTARSVYREFGARIVVGGKRVTDDYYEAAARERGDVEGEIADPNDRLPPAGEPYNKNQYVAWHGASQVYHTQPTSGTIPTAKQLSGKRRANVTVGNWQTEHATEASKFNSSLTALRRANLDGVYDTHTNLLLYPKITQPTHAKWSVVPDASEHLANGDSLLQTPTIFPPVPDLIRRNFAVVDTHFVSPARHNAGIPGPDGDAVDIGANGLSGVSQDLLDELPAECRTAFDEAVRQEREWKESWRGEGGGDGMRGGLKIGYAGFPV